MKESFYFPHDNDARNDDRILELRSCFWNETWYALFFFTLETMSKSSEWCINRVAIGGLSLGYWVGKELLEKFYAKCVELWLFYESDWKIFSQRMVEHKNSRKELSEAWKRGAMKRWENSPPISPPKIPPLARKGEERKGKENNTDSWEKEKDFDDFWELYGKKIDKEKCLKAFSRLSKTEREKLFEKLPAYISSTPDIKFRKNPLTYLHGKNWHDEQTPGTVKYFWLLDKYDSKIQENALARIKRIEFVPDGRWNMKPVTPTREKITEILYQAIIEVEIERMTPEQINRVRDRVNTWRKDNDYPSYKDTPLSVQVQAIEETLPT